MQEKELKELIGNIKNRKTESTHIEIKSAKEGCPEKLYDTFSSFSNTSGGIILAAEIAEMDSTSKPCFYSGKGKSKGAYIRVGDADLPMTEYEIYSYDSFKYKTEDELRISPRIDESIFNQIQLDGFFAKAVSLKPNLMNIDKKPFER